MNWLTPIASIPRARRAGPPTKEVREKRDRLMAKYLGMGLSQRDIAKLLDISRTSVQKRMRRS
jgi:transposase